MFANGTAADTLDEYTRLSESTMFQCLVFFFGLGLSSCMEKNFLRKPTEEDFERILRDSESQGIPGCISIWFGHTYMTKQAAAPIC
jgi:hypothetical protein